VEADAEVVDENVFVAIDADAAEDACFEPQASILSCLVSLLNSVLWCAKSGGETEEGEWHLFLCPFRCCASLLDSL
jgi:hypothetical protein